MKPNLEQLKAKRDKLKSILNTEDPLMKSFYGGRVGFKSGVSARKHEAKIEKEMSMRRELYLLEEKIKKIENPCVRKKAVEQNTNEWIVGDIAYEPFGTRVEIVKINSKTVSIKYEGGFKETIKPHLLSKK